VDSLLNPGHAWLIFFGAFFFGETLIFPAAALAAQGHFSPWAVGVWAYLGTIVSDTLWFSLAGVADRRLATWESWRRRYHQVLAWLDRRFGAHPERALLFIKFVYGTRIATITYLALRKLQLRRFLAYNGVGAAVWATVVVAAGWLAGRGVKALAPGLTNVEHVVLIVLVLALIVRGIVKWISNRELPR
jgi:membrane protein DedA with SNARE-associated domain